MIQCLVQSPGSLHTTLKSACLHVCSCVVPRILFEFINFGSLISPATYRIAGNFRGAIFSWILWFEACARKFYPRIPEPRSFMKQYADSYHEITHLLRNTKILPLENYLLYSIGRVGIAVVGNHYAPRLMNRPPPVLFQAPLSCVARGIIANKRT